MKKNPARNAFLNKDASKLLEKINSSINIDLRYASKKRKLLDKLSVNELQKFEKNITKDVFKVLSPINSMKTKSSFGGTSPENVKKSI